MLRHSKEIRHIFSGHPKSSEPSLLKVLSFMDDCIKYVLNEEYPSKIIDIDDYINNLKLESFDRNTIAIENALGDLPETYKNELANRFFTIYIHPDSSSILISNIEFVAPLLWKVLPKGIKFQIIRRLDQEIPRGNATVTEKVFFFTHVVGGEIYLSHTARKYKIEPLVERLKNNLDNWNIENECVRELSRYSAVIIEECIDDYVWALTQTYVGSEGSSLRFKRTNFFADIAALHIPTMFQAFNDRMIGAFIRTIHENEILRQRIRTPSKLRRLRSLGNIINEKMSETFEHRALIEALVDESQEENLLKFIKK